MAENRLFRMALMVVLASFTSLSAEAWLRAGESTTTPATLEPGTNSQETDTPENLADGISLASLPGESVGVFTADLKDRLEKDLKARRPVEFAFIARVIELVEADLLPLSLVDRCYLWARRQSTFPFQHFQRAVEIQAKQIGVSI